MGHSSSVTGTPPKGLMRALLRMPVWLYRLHLGWMLGSRFVLLNHVGRKSGKSYQTVVEVVDHDPLSDSTIIASGWGFQSNWYQNLLAHPELTIQVGRRRLAVRAEPVPPPEGARILIEYRTKHRIASRELSRMMGLDMATATPEQLEEMIAQSLPMLALRPR